jgi:hypothetical protein
MSPAARRARVLLALGCVGVGWALLPRRVPAAVGAAVPRDGLPYGSALAPTEVNGRVTLAPVSTLLLDAPPPTPGPPPGTDTRPVVPPRPTCLAASCARSPDADARRDAARWHDGWVTGWTATAGDPFGLLGPRAPAPSVRVVADPWREGWQAGAEAATTAASDALQPDGPPADVALARKGYADAAGYLPTVFRPATPTTDPAWGPAYNAGRTLAWHELLASPVWARQDADAWRGQPAAFLAEAATRHAFLAGSP